MCGAEGLQERAGVRAGVGSAIPQGPGLCVPITWSLKDVDSQAPSSRSLPASFFFFLIVFLAFPGPLLQHMEVPRIGVQSELLLPQSHSNAGSEPHLQLTPQLMTMPDPLTH